jgi:hypothetical protein
MGTTSSVPALTDKTNKVQLRNVHNGEFLYCGSKTLDEERRHVLTWIGKANDDPAMNWEPVPVTDKNNITGYKLKNNRGEFLYVGSKCLDDSRRYALTWVGNAYDDPAMLWKLVPEDKERALFRIRNIRTGEYLYVGSKTLDSQRRLALTWKGQANEDPAMVWEVLGLGVAGKTKETVDERKVGSIPLLTVLPNEVYELHERDPHATYLKLVNKFKQIPEVHTGPTPTSNWVVPGRLLASENPSFYLSEKDGAKNVKNLMAAGVRSFVCLHKRNVDRRSNYMKMSESELDEKERAKLEFTSFPIGDMRTRSNEELDELTDRIAHAVATRTDIVHFVHCTGGHGRTGTVVAVVLGKLFPSLTPTEAMLRIQLYHDCRQEYIDDGFTTHSPETNAQREQICAVLKIFKDRGSKIVCKEKLTFHSEMSHDFSGGWERGGGGGYRAGR